VAKREANAFRRESVVIVKRRSQDLRERMRRRVVRGIDRWLGNHVGASEQGDVEAKARGAGSVMLTARRAAKIHGSSSSGTARAKRPWHKGYGDTHAGEQHCRPVALKDRARTGAAPKADRQRRKARCRIRGRRGWYFTAGAQTWRRMRPSGRGGARTIRGPPASEPDRFEAFPGNAMRQVTRADRRGCAAEDRDKCPFR